MGRRSSFSSLMNQIARDAARAQREAEAARKRDIRESERATRELARNLAIAEKEAKIRHLEGRAVEADNLNLELSEQILSLRSILEHTLSKDDTIKFSDLKKFKSFKQFTPPPELSTPQVIPNRNAFFANIKPPNAITRLMPGVKTKYEEACNKAEGYYLAAVQAHELQEAARKQKLHDLEVEYQTEKQNYLDNIAMRTEEIDEFETAYRTGDPDGISAYCTMVLERSEYPQDFPQEFRIAYVQEPKEIVIEYELPGPEIIPTTSEYKFIKSKDIIEEKPRKPTDIKDLYQEIVASVALRTIHEVFEADQGNHVALVTFNGFVQTVDASTGKDIRPCLISVRVAKDRFEDIDLKRIDKRACLRNLGAQVSPRPAEMLAVKPIIEFDMVDKRFVEQSDILGDLESRPNLMDLDPFAFENLVSNLFDRMGLQTKQTRSSKDGGVDAVAYDNRPVLGGKIVIQAKRYKNTVGVSAARDLYGTMINEGANKGILVTTSSYGADAYEFCKDKPIELIDGGGLLYLLEQNGVKARIVFPED